MGSKGKAIGLRAAIWRTTDEERPSNVRSADGSIDGIVGMSGRRIQTQCVSIPY